MMTMPRELNCLSWAKYSHHERTVKCDWQDSLFFEWPCNFVFGGGQYNLGVRPINTARGVKPETVCLDQ